MRGKELLPEIQALYAKGIIGPTKNSLYPVKTPGQYYREKSVAQ
jgi:hypothetical protein